MSGIEAFERSDSGEVAELFVRAFGGAEPPPAARVQAYLHRIHFDNPFYDPDRGCIVHRDDRGRIDGFLAGYPLRLRCRGRSLRGAVVGTYMVHPEARDPFAAIRLVRAFLERRPDVVVSDTANDLARRIWAGMGVCTDRLLSMGWARPLRPLRFSLAFLAKRHGTSKAWMAGALGALARVPDAGAAALDERFLASGTNGLMGVELTAATMSEGAQRVWARRALVPEYDPDHLEWLFAALSEKRRYGPLRKREVRDGNGSLGWYLYYPNAGGVGQVVQVAAAPDQFRRVLKHLMADARASGSVGLVGKVDPEHTEDLSACGCVLFQRRPWTFVHAHDAEAREALLRHDVMLSRLEGDWWTRLSGNDLA